MRNTLTFLVIADDPHRLMLVSTTLHRRFPNSVVQTCRYSEVAVDVAATQHLDAIVAQRGADAHELPLVENLRAVTKVPIVLMGNAAHERAAIAAGASHFLHLDEWLLIGTVIAKLINVNPVET